MKEKCRAHLSRSKGDFQLLPPQLSGYMHLNDFIFAWKTFSLYNDAKKSEGSVITELNSKANAMGHNVLLDAVFQLSYSSRAGG